jgi:hypothetical protein
LFAFYRIFCGEPVSTSPENAFAPIAGASTTLPVAGATAEALRATRERADERHRGRA